MRYRRSIYRKSNVHLYVITALCSALAVTLIFVIAGNALGKKVEESQSERNTSKNTEAEQTAHSSVRSVNACTVPLSAEGSKLEDRLKSVAENGYSDICFELDAKNGDVLYSSDVAVSMGYLSADTKLWKLTDAVKLFDENQLYSIGITYLSRLNDDSDLQRSVAAGYYAAFAAEAIRAGIDEIMLFPKDLPPERYGELAEIAHQIHRLCPEGTVGVALPASAFSTENSEQTVDLLWSAFDYIAVDTTSAPNEGESVADKIDRELGGMLYYLLRYNVRVLIPSSSDEQSATAILQVIKSNGTENIQIVP